MRALWRALCAGFGLLASGDWVSQGASVLIARIFWAFGL
jgi:hypothetical protein